MSVRKRELGRRPGKSLPFSNFYAFQFDPLLTSRFKCSLLRFLFFVFLFFLFNWKDGMKYEFQIWRIFLKFTWEQFNLICHWSGILVFPWKNHFGRHVFKFQFVNTFLAISSFLSRLSLILNHCGRSPIILIKIIKSKIANMNGSKMGAL